nr:NAD(P)/FAD-dependent oxidoreductase [Oceanococcus sp. HetDA_MAG_MS8]
MKTDFDVLIIGAGVSGIGMACHLRRNCPQKTYTILERRQDLGGTWDLFRYPGIRSDSDMYTFGYNFRPWTGGQVLADGSEIKNYVRDTAREYGVDKNIRYGCKVTGANWSSKNKCWTVHMLDEASGKTSQLTARFVVGATGYYNYDTGFKPDFPGEKDFAGQLIHPQHWPENLDYSGKKVVVIGSGATAVTLVPAMADKAEHVTMLQRSPTYMMPVPKFDPLAGKTQRWLPKMLAYRITRSRNLAAQRFMYQASKRRPAVVKRFLRGLVRAQVGPNISMRHFSPRYNPWDERLCAVSDGDLFKALKAGTASMVTDRIKRFTKTGIELESGQTLEADIIISATGLDVQMLGGAQLHVDNKAVSVRDTMVYKNVLVEGVPNAGMIFGYTNLPWTLKADIAAEYICRLLNHMDMYGHVEAVARDREGVRRDESVMGSLQSGYIQRADKHLPRQGASGPWLVAQDYPKDVETARHAPIEDGVIAFDGILSRPSGQDAPTRGMAAIRALTTRAGLAPS